MRVVVQRGHVFRTRGQTGTAGHRGTEQEFVVALSEHVERHMVAAGHEVFLIGADDYPIPESDVFLSFHQDGSLFGEAQGGSCGYPASSEESARYAQLWKAIYALHGHPYGFRPDNYTAGLRGYYSFGYTQAPVRVLMEHGFATNFDEENWMWDHLDLIGRAHLATLHAYFGITGNTPAPTPVPPTPTPDEEDDMRIFVRDETGKISELVDRPGHKSALRWVEGDEWGVLQHVYGSKLVDITSAEAATMEAI